MEDWVTTLRDQHPKMFLMGALIWLELHYMNIPRHYPFSTVILGSLEIIEALDEFHHPLILKFQRYSAMSELQSFHLYIANDSDVGDFSKNFC